MKTRVLVTVTALAFLAACAESEAPQNERIGHTSQALTNEPLAATFGADDINGLFACNGLDDVDGVPVVFPAPLDAQTIDPASFVVENGHGDRVVATCATFAPAVDGDEMRTVLLQGYFGTRRTNEPVRVHVTGPVLGTDGSSYENSSVGVAPFSKGQYLVYARRQTTTNNLGGTNQCPATSSDGVPVRQVVQLAFGSNAGNTFPTSAQYRSRFVVALDDGSTAIPVAFGDTTPDNYLELCLTETAPAKAVTIAPLTVRDASDQFNEEETSVVLEN